MTGVRFETPQSQLRDGENKLILCKLFIFKTTAWRRLACIHIRR
jgi:hypothetical protein